MKTEHLIEQLAKALTPVRPLPRPWRRSLSWLLLAVVYLAVVAFAAFRRHSMLAASFQPQYLVQQATLMATAVTAAVAAFVSVIPGGSRRVMAAPVFTASVLVATFAWGCINDVRLHGTLGVASQTDWPCVVSISLGGTFLWWMMGVMLRRGAALTPRLTGLFAGTAALSIGNLEACLTRAHPFTSSMVVWHGLTSAAMIALLGIAGSHVFRWPDRTLGREHLPRTP